MASRPAPRRKRTKDQTRAHDYSDNQIHHRTTKHKTQYTSSSQYGMRPSKKYDDVINPSNNNYPRPYTYRVSSSTTRPPNSRESSHIRFPDRQTGALSSTTGGRTTTTTTTTATTTISKTSKTSSATSSSTNGKPRSKKISTSSNSSTSSRPYGYPKPLGHGNGFPVVSVARYISPQSTSFHIVPGPARRYRTYEIHDKFHAPCFRIVPTPLCLRETKTLIDIRRTSRVSSVGCPVLKSHQSVFSTRGRVFIHDLNNAKSLLYLQKVNIVNFPKIIHGFVRLPNNQHHQHHRQHQRARNIKYGHNNKPQLIITQEEEEGPYYIIRDRRSNEIACVERYRLNSRNERKRKYAYKLYVSAGYDHSLFVMCAVLLLDMWNK